MFTCSSGVTNIPLEWCHTLMDTNRNAALPLFLDVSVISLILLDSFCVNKLFCGFVFFLSFSCQPHSHSSNLINRSCCSNIQSFVFSCCLHSADCSSWPHALPCECCLACWACRCWFVWAGLQLKQGYRDWFWWCRCLRWWRRVVRGPRALVAGERACPVPATRRWTNWTFTTTKPCRTAAASVSFCPMMTRSMS